MLIPAVILLILASAAYLEFSNRDDAATPPDAAPPPVAGAVKDPRPGTASSATSRVRATPVALDFNGDRRSDWVVAREMGSGLTWLISSASGQTSTGWGRRGDQTVPADYDGDGKTDLAVWRAGTFYIRRSSDSGETVRPWGQAGDDATVVADYDGDGKADVAVYRPGAPSLWLVSRSGDGAPMQRAWGQQGDVAAPADYDGDGRADFAVKRGAPGSLEATFYLQLSTGGRQEIPWGVGTDLVVRGRLRWRRQSGSGDGAAGRKDHQILRSAQLRRRDD